MKKREGNYDLLRIVSAVAVIMIHVSKNAINDISKRDLPIEEILSPFWLCICNSMSRFAVPCFVMLSGTFILDNEKNIEYKDFYVKSLSKIGIPTIVFSILYAFYQISFCFVGEDKGIHTLVKNIVVLVKNTVIGYPMYHMWYMYMLIGLYILVPIIIRFKQSISERSFHKITFVFLIFASISMWTSTYKLSWDVGYSFEYLGYFMVGYSIRKINSKKNNGKAILAVLAGLLLELCATVLRYYKMAGNYIVSPSSPLNDMVSPSSPLIVLASVLIFYGFTVLDLKKDLTKLSSLTFWIYLIHAGVWDFISRIIILVKGMNAFSEMDGLIWIPVFVVIVFAISCILSKLYIWLWRKIDKENRITNMLLRIVHL